MDLLGKRTRRAKVLQKTDLDPTRPLPWQHFAGPRPTVGIMVVHPYHPAVLLIQPQKDLGRTTYMLPQGGIDDGESIYAAARRELCEEFPSFARKNARKAFKVNWKNPSYFGAALNATARSGQEKMLHVVLFQALAPDIHLNAEEIYSAEWFYSRRSVLAVMQNTRAHSLAKWYITLRALIAAKHEGRLQLPK